MPKKFSLSQIMREQAPHYEAPDFKPLGELFVAVKLQTFWHDKLLQTGYFKDKREASRYYEAAQSLIIRPDEAKKELKSSRLDPDKLARIVELERKTDELSNSELRDPDKSFEIFRDFYQRELGVEPGELEFFIIEYVRKLNDRYIESAFKMAKEKGLNPSTPEGKRFLADKWGVYERDNNKPRAEVTEFNPKNRK